MNISLTPELEQYVNSKVSSGMYTSASEVVRESLRLLYTYEELQNQRVHQLNQAIEVGLHQLKTGKKISAKTSYDKMKNKIDKLARNPNGSE
jgi:antitoxin ParD1/3/4